MTAIQIQHSRTTSLPRIAYAACGREGIPVFFLHGIGGNKSNWFRQLVYFAGRGFRAIAWDVRGYGDSDDFEGDFDFKDISNDLVRLMEELGVGSAHFVGLSMGGRILMDFGFRHPERVMSLTLCGAFPSFDNALSAEQRNDYLRLRKAPLLAGKSFEELAPRLIEALAGPTISDAAYRELHASICDLRKPSYLKALDAAAHFDRVRELQAIDARVLLLYAENDRLTPPEMGRNVAAQMRNARFEIFPDCGHLMNLEAPDAFNERVFDFITGKRDMSESMSVVNTTVPRYFLVHCLDDVGKEALRESLKNDHRAYIQENRSRILMGGPLMDDAGTKLIGSVIVLKADSKCDVQSLMAAEPYSKHGVFKNIDIRAFHCAVLQPDLLAQE